MTMEEVFNKYYKKLAGEGWLKAVFFGLSVAFVTVFVTGVICYFTGFGGIWFPLTVFGVVAVGAVLGSYFLKFKPDKRVVARRIDSLGLEERLITMQQFANDNSYIAQKQREDTEKALKAFNGTLLKVLIPTSLIVALAVTSVFGIGMTTVQGLADSGVIKGGKEIIEDITEDDPVYFEVEYTCDAEQGEIIGEIFQVIEKGKNATGVLAVANDGYVFVGWSDGFEEPYREDFEIVENMQLTANFEQGGEGDEDGEGDPGEGEGEADQASDAPSDNEGQQDDSGQGQEPSDDPGGGEGGQWKENDAINNGSDDYGDHFSSAYGDATEGAGGLNGGQQSAISEYFGSIAKGGK